MKKNISIFLLFALAFSLAVHAGGKKSKEYRYEIFPVGVGSQGTALIKVFSYARSEKEAIELAKENGVHGILFKGIVGGNGVSNQPPLVKPEEKEMNQDFFDKFFSSGAYLQYVSLSSDGTVSSGDRLKVGNLYKIGIIVSVNKSELRKYLESEGVIKKFGSIF